MNVLFLIVDCLRADYLGCYGNTNVHSPAVDKLASEGVLFEKTIASATWTPPSMSAIFSGIYPHRLGMYRFEDPFLPNVKTLFHYFSEKKYRIGSYVFDEECLFKNFNKAKVQDNFRDFEKPLNWIKDNYKHNFFLFIHYYWVHGPYEPQPSAKAWSSSNKKILKGLREKPNETMEHCKTLYLNAVEKMSEEWLVQIRQTLEELNILDDTLIILTGDHGESWGERYDDKTEIQVNYHLHGKLIYDVLLRIPLIMRYPKYIDSGGRVKTQVRHVDIAPTVLDICGIKLTTDSNYMEIDGISLCDRIKNNGKGEDLPAISSAMNLNFKHLGKISIRKPPWKLIWSIDENFHELYNIENDPRELINIYENNPKITNELEQILEKELDKVPMDKLPDEDQEEIERRLKRLGYM